MILLGELESQAQDGISRTRWLDETEQQHTFLEISQSGGAGNLRDGKPEIQPRHGVGQKSAACQLRKRLARHLGGFTGRILQFLEKNQDGLQRIRPLCRSSQTLHDSSSRRCFEMLGQADLELIFYS